MNSEPGRRWVETEVDGGSTQRLASALHLDPLAARVLVARGLRDPEVATRFLATNLSDLPDPFSMRGMEAAVLRIARALDAKERIACYGDYDVDGVTSTVLLTGFLRAVGGDVVTYVPHRIREGYGLNSGAVAKLAASGVRLLVTLDCGITAASEVKAAASLGLDTVVVDHHTVPVELPQACAILNPHQPGCGFPSKDLAAVGVTFVLLMALRKHLRDGGKFTPAHPEPNLKEALDLVALGTVADVVPLLEANRVLVRWGLEALAKSRRPGVRALMAVSGVAPGAPVSAGQVGFRLAPRINAAGRIDDADRGVRLLLETDPARAQEIAEELDRDNRARQEIEKRILEEAMEEAETRVKGGARGLVLAREGWHPGVVGIVASRVVERFHRPAVLVALENGAGKGSGRSVERFHLYDALSACSEHLVGYGGHKHAAGLTIAARSVDAFRCAFEGYAADRLSPEDLAPRMRIDGGWVKDGELTPRAAQDLERLAPFGAGNPEPVFAIRGKPDRVRPVGAGGVHLKLALCERLEAIGFGLGERRSICGGDLVEAAFTLGFDEWDGNRRLQLRLKDLREPV